jgi:hypothetical protein
MVNGKYLLMVLQVLRSKKLPGLQYTVHVAWHKDQTGRFTSQTTTTGLFIRLPIKSKLITDCHLERLWEKSIHGSANNFRCIDLPQSFEMTIVYYLRSQSGVYLYYLDHEVIL